MGKSVSQVEKDIVDILLDFPRTWFNRVLTSNLSEMFAVSNEENVMMIQEGKDKKNNEDWKNFLRCTIRNHEQ